MGQPVSGVGRIGNEEDVEGEGVASPPSLGMVRQVCFWWIFVWWGFALREKQLYNLSNPVAITPRLDTSSRLTPIYDRNSCT
jgi:hypothetical protein